MPLSGNFLSFPLCECDASSCLFHEQMLTDILSFRILFEKVKLRLDAGQLKQLENYMLTSFLVEMQRGEDVGFKNYDKTLELINNSASIVLSDRKTLETVNLYNAFRFIHTEIKTDHELGLLEIDYFILKLHHHLMTGLISETGEFCTNVRYTTYNQVRHVYPTFSSTCLARESLITVVDKLNILVTEVKSISDTRARMASMFKFSSLLLSSLLSLHLFSDGNGRVCKMLTAYVLLLVSPFMSPCSGSRDNYIQQVIAARKDINLLPRVNTLQDARMLGIQVLTQKPIGLCSILLESNWYMWKACFAYLRQHSNTLGEI